MILISSKVIGVDMYTYGELGCKQLDHIEYGTDGQKDQESSEDVISREAVCDYIAEFINHEYSTQSEREMVDLMIDGIQHMPSVKPKTGHWIVMGDRYIKCSECGHITKTESPDIYNFCMVCGAKMSERSEDTDV